MTDKTKNMTFTVNASRIDAHESSASCKDATLTIDTDLQGRRDAFNPAELLMASLAACMLKGIERVTPILKFELTHIEIELQGERQDVPPKMASIEYTIKIDSNESDHRLALLHDNVKKYGTVFNTLKAGTDISGTLIRM